MSIPYISRVNEMSSTVSAANSCSQENLIFDNLVVTSIRIQLRIFSQHEIMLAEWKLKWRLRLGVGDCLGDHKDKIFCKRFNLARNLWQG